MEYEPGGGNRLHSCDGVGYSCLRFGRIGLQTEKPSIYPMMLNIGHHAIFGRL
jgi:hypothetical protein